MKLSSLFLLELKDTWNRHLINFQIEECNTAQQSSKGLNYLEHLLHKIQKVQENTFDSHEERKN